MRFVGRVTLTRKRIGDMAETAQSFPKSAAFSGSEWIAILKRVWAKMNEHRLSLVAAGVAFYGLLSLFPAITAVIAIGGLVFEPSELTDPIQRFSELLPSGAADIVLSQATSVAGSDSGGLGLAAVIGILLALYSASRGVANLIMGLNVAYDETRKRGFVKLQLVILALTVFLVIGVIVALGVVLAVPFALNLLHLGTTIEALATILPWALLLVFSVAAFAVLYRYGPDRARARWSYTIPGAIFACLLWVAASAGFSIYADNFGSYQESFGTLAGAIVLLMWLWLSAYVVLIGAELNGEIEARRHRDTTAGAAEPRGQRGAHKADEWVGGEL